MVSRRYIEATLAEMVFAPSSVDICASGLVNIILAIGCRLEVGMEKRQKSFDATVCDSQSWKYFDRALQCRRGVSTGPSSLLKVQASDYAPSQEAQTSNNLHQTLVLMVCSDYAFSKGIFSIWPRIDVY